MKNTMHVLPLHTRLLKVGDNLATSFLKKNLIQSDDIIIVSSKAIATTEGAQRMLADVIVSAEAKTIAKETKQSPSFVEAILQETQRLRGRIVHRCPGAVLTEVSPKGMRGSILIANAGLDQSNAGDDVAIGWPEDPVASIRQLHAELEKQSGVRLAVILSDSCSLPRRKGVVAIALAVSGLDPLLSLEGKNDLFGRPLAMTTEAIADQLATAANTVMGNAAGSTPAAIVREHGFTLSDFEGWVPGIPGGEDLFGLL